MALVRNNLSLRMKGRAGSFSFYSSKGRQVARVAQNSSNYGESARRSEAQQVRRVKWSNLVNFYKLTMGSLHGAFETKRTNETDYNAFMRKNLGMASVALTKEQASLGCCAPQEFQLSEGSLYSPNVYLDMDGEDMAWFFGIKMTSGKAWDTETVADFTEDLLAKNSWAKVGMQISVISVSCDGNVESPRSLVERHELTLSDHDPRKVAAVFGQDGWATSSNGNLINSNLSADAYIALIISDSTTGQLKVSTSKLNGGDSEPERVLSDEEHVRAAMESYGVDPARFLDSGDLK